MIYVHSLWDNFLELALDKCTISACFYLVLPMLPFVIILYSADYFLDVCCWFAAPTTLILEVKYWICLIRWCFQEQYLFELTLDVYAKFQLSCVSFRALYILGRISVHLLDLLVGCASNNNIEHIETQKISTLFVVLNVSCQMWFWIRLVLYEWGKK